MCAGLYSVLNIHEEVWWSCGHADAACVRFWPPSRHCAAADLHVFVMECEVCLAVHFSDESQLSKYFCLPHSCLLHAVVAYTHLFQASWCVRCSAAAGPHWRGRKCLLRVPLGLCCPVSAPNPPILLTGRPCQARKGCQVSAASPSSTAAGRAAAAPPHHACWSVW